MATTLYSGDFNTGIIPTIDCYGDSLTAGAGGTPYPLLLTLQFPDRIINNYGIGGQTMQQIAARQGGLPVYLSITNNIWDGVNAVTVTSISTPLLSTAADTVTRTLSGHLMGVPCVLTRTVSSGNEVYTVKPVGTRSSGVPVNSQFFPFDSKNSQNHIQILAMGRNNVPALTGLDTLVDNCINLMKRPRRFLVLGVVNAQSETNTTTNFAAIQNMNTKLLTTYGERFVSVAPPSVDEMKTLNYTPTTQDLADISNGIMPAAFVADNVHRTTLGYQLWANRIAYKLLQLGW